MWGGCMKQRPRNWKEHWGKRNKNLDSILNLPCRFSDEFWRVNYFLILNLFPNCPLHPQIIPMGSFFKKLKEEKKSWVLKVFPVLILKTDFHRHFSCDGQFDFTREKNWKYLYMNRKPSVVEQAIAAPGEMLQHPSAGTEPPLKPIRGILACTSHVHSAFHEMTAWSSENASLCPAVAKTAMFKGYSD